MTDAPRRRRQSPAVYRRRRLAAGLLALLVIGLVVWLVAAPPWRAAPTAEATPAPAASAPVATATTTAPVASGAPSASPSVSPTPTAPAGPVECTASDITVAALSDKSEYAQGENPQLSIKLTNTSANPCTMNVGTSAQSFTVTSGSDVWWRSTDCQAEPSDMEVTLAAGQVVTSSAPLTWDRTRSSVNSCGGERPYAPGGGATYHLSVSIGGIPSSGTASFILR
ncbi:cytoskeletal protein RodZ [Microbacterium testaceum]|uniref:hypothetical protein n=1 Tax=Microbacterium TaxID=33882 RepID=UPI001AE0FF48|nr:MULTISPECIES: hypothetical protein [Microbacterium]MDQ1112603.1 cytoskeletal protein RodZ [Microbacterium testaceum]MDQ1176717.1 cytoskeletal protein RodZ [Microbacterium sp. SORGH_AS_0421]MDR6096857.1 cytoskeletal protein RodZ [Microbacterium sp. SORGH_AS_0454]WAC70590.1 hypothetical protein OVA17_07820 [Microbacterium sp. SL75]